MSVSNSTQIDILKHRKDFPVLEQQVHGKPLVYLDNGATSQKPKAVIDAIEHYYSAYNSNIHRGVHHLSQEATAKYEEAREKIRAFINAEHSHEVLFTKGTTDGINLVASSFGRHFIQEGDEVLISAMEHHSNIVPWQMICEEKGATLKVIPINQKGELILDQFDALLNSKTRLLAVTHISNSLGSVNPVKELIAKAHANGTPVLVDGAQSVQHMAVDVRELDADFYSFSAHKMFGPTGIGVLYGKEEWLNQMPPYQGGGDMIKTVTFEKTTYNELPHKFEAGTPNIVGGIALGAAVDYINSIGYDAIGEHETHLMEYATKRLQEIPNIRFIGEANEKASVISFLIGDLHPYDVGTILDQLGVAVRTGHHCTQPLMNFFEIPGTVRASFAFYNTTEDIDQLIEGLQRAVKMLS